MALPVIDSGLTDLWGKDASTRVPRGAGIIARWIAHLSPELRSCSIACYVIGLPKITLPRFASVCEINEREAQLRQSRAEMEQCSRCGSARRTIVAKMVQSYSDAGGPVLHEPWQTIMVMGSRVGRGRSRAPRGLPERTDRAGVDRKNPMLPALQRNAESAQAHGLRKYSYQFYIRVI